MPFVPSINQSSSSTPAFGAPGVVPERNYAPEQLEQAGATLQQAGATATRTGQSIGMRVNEELDDAKTKAAHTQALSQVQDLLYGDQGYLRTKGQTAQDQYDQTATKLSKIYSDASAGLDNDIQRKMFKQVANQNMLSFGKDMADHRFQQVSAYSAKEASDRADMLGQQAANAYKSRDMVDEQGNPTGDFTTYWHSAVQEAQRAAQVGFGAPPDSAQSKALVKEKTTSMAQGVIARLMDDHAYAEAKTFYEKQLAAGNIDERQAEALGNAIKSNADRDQIVNFTNDRIQAVLSAGTKNPFMAAANPKGLVEQGNLPIWNRPVVQNADGSHSSEYSTSFEDDKGHEVLVPTVVNGKFLTPDGKKPEEGSDAEKAMFRAAWDHYLKTGENLGKFQSAADADAYSQVLHNRGDGVPRAYPIPVQGGAITSTMGEPRPGGRSHDGIDIAVPVGTAVQSPADGVVQKVWNDDKFGGGLSMQVRHADGTVTGYAHLSSTNYQEGQNVTQGQTIALTGKTGNATGPVLHYTMTDPSGQKIDPRSAGQAQQDPKSFTDPNDLAKVVDAINASDQPPYLKKEMISYAESQQRHFRVIQNEAYEENKKNAVDQWYTAGGDYTKIDPSAWGALRPEDQYELKKGLPEKSDFTTLLGFAEHPETLTPQAVESARPKLSQSDTISLMKQATERANRPDAVRSASFDEENLKSTMIKNGFQNLVHPKAGSEEEAIAVQLRTRISDEIDQAQTATGKELTRQQKQQIIDGVFTNHVQVNGVFGSVENVPSFTINKDNIRKSTFTSSQGITRAYIPIPDDVRNRIVYNRSIRNLPINDESIYNDWVNQGMPGSTSFSAR